MLSRASESRFGLLQQPKIPIWKWERITMDFVSGFPRTPSGYDTIWVIVDRLTKLAHFLHMKKIDSMEKLMRLYLKEISPEEVYAIKDISRLVFESIEEMGIAQGIAMEGRWIHSTFHVSNLKKCLAKGDVVVPIEEIQLDDKLHVIKEPVEIVDKEVKRLKQSGIPIVKVR
ncbi:reverse transcriptase domain-containing protein [Tanacetum coccineum]|uniref:Reverse transcriptase domain-containing protein n=1 Tax=Tanacetum coccineum TaxID=301880 RepID=A0ABQ5H592_9ASTR